MKKILILGALSLFGLSDAGAMSRSAVMGAPQQAASELKHTVDFAHFKDCSLEEAAEALVYGDTDLVSRTIESMKASMKTGRKRVSDLGDFCHMGFARLMSLGAYEAAVKFINNKDTSWMAGQVYDKVQRNHFALGGKELWHKVANKMSIDDVREYCSRVNALADEERLGKESAKFDNSDRTAKTSPYGRQLLVQQAYMIMSYWEEVRDQDTKEIMGEAVRNLLFLERLSSDRMESCVGGLPIMGEYDQQLKLLQDNKGSNDLFMAHNRQVFQYRADTPEGKRERGDAIKNRDWTKGSFENGLGTEEGKKERVSALLGVLSMKRGIRGNTVYRNALIEAMCKICNIICTDYNICYEGVGLFCDLYRGPLSGSNVNIYVLNSCIQLYSKGIGNLSVTRKQDESQVDGFLRDVVLLQKLNAGWGVMLKGYCSADVDDNLCEMAEDFKCSNDRIIPVENGRFRVENIKRNYWSFVKEPQTVTLEVGKWGFVPLDKPIAPGGLPDGNSEMMLETPLSPSSTVVQYKGEMAGAAEASSEGASSSSSTADRYKGEMPEMSSVMTKPSPKVAVPLVREEELFRATDLEVLLNEQLLGSIEELLNRLRSAL